MAQRTVFITGANRGIGASLASEMLKRGHRVIGGARHWQKTTSDNGILKLEIDVSNEDSIAHCFRQINELGSLDILVNNAGVYEDDSKFIELSAESLRRSFDVNTSGPLCVTQAALPLLLRSDAPIVANITSLMGSISDNSSGGSYAYRMSKAALNMFGKTFAIDFPKITTLLLHPGWVNTEMGGPSAPTLPDESANGLADVILKATREHSGRFFDFEGDELPW